MVLALIVYAEPPLAFYQGARPAGVDLAWPRLIDISEIRAELRISGGEAPSASATLDTADGALLADLAAYVPMAEAGLWVGGEEVFRGQVTGLELGTTTTLEIEA